MKGFITTLAAVTIFAAMTIEPSTNETSRARPSPTHAQNCSDYPPYRCFGKTPTLIPATPIVVTEVVVFPTATPKPTATATPRPTISATAMPATPTPQPTTRQSPPTAPTGTLQAPGVVATTSTPLSVQTPSSVAQGTFVVVVRGTAVVVRGLPKSGEAPLWEQR